MKNKQKPDTLTQLLDKSYQYDLEYDYNTVSHCEEKGCNEEGICRCSTLENFHIEKVRVCDVANDFCSLAEDEFTRYCIHRAIVSCKLWNPDCWYARIEMSYYGEEIEDITIESASKKEVRDILSMIMSANTDKEKLFIVLETEYGYILPELKNIDEFNICTVDKAIVHAGSEEHYRKLNTEVVDQYKNYSLPVGVGIMKDGHIRLIDGYHRFAAHAKENFSKIKLIVGHLYI